MDAAECRKRAALCLRRAGEASGELRANFLLAAETWISLAEEFERARAIAASGDQAQKLTPQRTKLTRPKSSVGKRTPDRQGSLDPTSRGAPPPGGKQPRK